MITMNRTGMILKMLCFQNKHSKGTLIATVESRTIVRNGETTLLFIQSKM
jgi:hypothetical protein